MYPLNEHEKSEKGLMMETYVNICVKSYEILNSLEFRLFLELEMNLQIYMNPPNLLYYDKLNDFNPISVKFIPSTRIVFILTSDYDPTGKFSLKKIFGGISNFWGSSKQLTGNLYLLKEKINKSLQFETKACFDFQEDTPTVMEIVESSMNIYIGFSSGVIGAYKIEKMSQMVQLSKYDCHKQPVKLLTSLCQEGLLLSTSDDRALMVNDLNSIHGFYQEETNFLYPLSCMNWNQKYGILFLGDISGRMHIYKQGNEFRGKKFTLVYTEKLFEDKITSIATDNNERYIFVCYYKGLVEIYETGKGFQSTPSLIKNFKIGDSINSMQFLNKSKTLIFSNDKGCLLFCDFVDSNNFFVHLLHKDVVLSYSIAEDERLIITGSKDKYSSISFYDEKLFNSKISENRKIIRWKTVDIEDYFFPDNFVKRRMKRETENLPNQRITEKKETEGKSNDPELKEVKTINREDDDLIGWDS